MKLVTLSLLIINLYQSEQQNSGNNSDDCQSQMENYRQCIKKNVNSNNNNNRHLSTQERQQLKNNIAACFTKERCQNPFPSAQYQSATRQCYQTARSESRQELQSCVRRSVSGFILPEDETKEIENMQLAASLLLAAKDTKTCPLFTNKARIIDCIKSETGVFQNSQTGGRAKNDQTNICQVREECNKQINAKCTSIWNDKVAPSLCKCISSEMLARYRQEYGNCVQDRGFKVQNNDPTANLLENSIKSWCPPKDAKTNDPCLLRATTASAPAAETTAAETTTAEAEVTLDMLTVESSESVTQIKSTSTSTSTVEITTSVTEASTTTVIPNQNFFSALGSDEFFQNLIKQSPGLKALTDLFTGKTDLSAIFPSANLIGDYSVGLANMFGHVGG